MAALKHTYMITEGGYLTAYTDGEKTVFPLEEAEALYGVFRPEDISEEVFSDIGVYILRDSEGNEESRKMVTLTGLGFIAELSPLREKLLIYRTVISEVVPDILYRYNALPDEDKNAGREQDIFGNLRIFDLVEEK